MFNTFVSEHHHFLNHAGESKNSSHHFLQSEATASGHHDFLRTEPKKKTKEEPTDIFADSLSSLNLHPLHNIAVQTSFLSTNYEGLNNYNQITDEENIALVDLEKNFDWCVLKARMNISKIGNNNTSIADTQKDEEHGGDDDVEKGDLCGSHGDISATYKKNFKKEFDSNWIEFPMVNMDDEFGIHWSRKDNTCLSNSFTNKDATHFDLNNTRYSYRRFKKLMNKERNKYQKEQFGKWKKKKLKKKDGRNVTERRIKKWKKEAAEGPIPAAIYKKVFYLTIFPEGDWEAFEARRRGQSEDDEEEEEDDEDDEDEEEEEDDEDESEEEDDEEEEEDGATFAKHMYGQAAYGSYRMRAFFIAQYKREQNPETNSLFDIHFLEPEPPFKKTVQFEEKEISSQFGTQSVSESLKIDKRLLGDNEYFSALDVPPILMGTVLRKGFNDYHCVHFENNNAMGQLKKWATILLVRPGEIDQYVERYASEHTFFVQLPDRVELDSLKQVGLTGEKSKGYSAGDSKFYCWRVAQWLHQKWGTSPEQQKCIIMDDQMNPFVHQVPSFKTKKGNYSDEDKPRPDNDQYAFRSTITDENGRSMMDRTNIRFPTTHAATFMYMDKVADITGAGLVCLNSKEADIHNTTLTNRPFANAVWFINLNVMSNKLSEAPFLQAALQPAYQAAEDTLFRAVCTDRKIRMVVCSTLRWRKQVAGGGTCGRACVAKKAPVPFRPIIKYHDLAKMYTFSPSRGVKMNLVKKIPKAAKSRLLHCFPLTECAYISEKKTKTTFKPSKTPKSILVNTKIYIKYNNKIWGCVLGKDTKPKVSWDNGRTFEDINFANQYTPRHIFSVFVLKMMGYITSKSRQLEPNPTAVVDGIRYPYDDCTEGSYYRDSDNDYVYYLKGGHVDIYDENKVPKPQDEIFWSLQEFAENNKELTLTEMGEYSKNDVYRKPRKGDSVTVRFMGKGGKYLWHKGEIIKSRRKGVYNVKYKDKIQAQYQNYFSRDKFNRSWKWTLREESEEDEIEEQSEEESTKDGSEEESDEESEEEEDDIPSVNDRIAVLEEMEDGSQEWFDGEIIAMTPKKTKFTIKWDDENYTTSQRYFSRVEWKYSSDDNQSEVESEDSSIHISDDDDSSDHSIYSSDDNQSEVESEDSSIHISDDDDSSDHSIYSSDDNQSEVESEENSEEEPRTPSHSPRGKAVAAAERRLTSSGGSKLTPEQQISLKQKEIELARAKEDRLRKEIELSKLQKKMELMKLQRKGTRVRKQVKPKTFEEIGV
jgi:hypothetical protein